MAVSCVGFRGVVHGQAGSTSRHVRTARNSQGKAEFVLDGTARTGCFFQARSPPSHIRGAAPSDTALAQSVAQRRPRGRCTRTSRNQMQETAISVEFVPGMRFLVFEFGEGPVLTKGSSRTHWMQRRRGLLSERKTLRGSKNHVKKVREAAVDLEGESHHE
eukprot:611880-Rhodomonas_salina.1